ncbi:hypothetical protein [Bradyrhizobium sp. BR 10289]|uniref:hypothetical protein n=1 Tax=Bradyrhizobium sp. BR 10289 TaxID=2749993 RepID=UPI001C64D7E9|nr:hypothetical protein [Bradyrhizobium sp. BR 10289]MBW7971545.1 hypothetical protein [Bradyrhizobium sp. BR 10289]
MISAAIFSFLAGAVLAWAFRVWILVPLTLLALLFGFVVDIASDATVLDAFGHALLVGMAPQFGYAFGLITRSTLTGLRAPMRPKSPRSASVAVLYKKNAMKRPH